MTERKQAQFAARCGMQKKDVNFASFRLNGMLATVRTKMPDWTMYRSNFEARRG